MMRMSSQGRNLLAQWEGIRYQQYDDVVGLPTIGVGHLITSAEIEAGAIQIRGEAVDYRQGLTDQLVMDLLAEDLEKFESAVNGAVEVNLSQNQFDALVSFAFNIGTEAFRKSTLVTRLNQQAYDEVPDQLRRWVKAGGETIPGLVNRREKEIALWLS